MDIINNVKNKLTVARKLLAFNCQVLGKKLSPRLLGGHAKTYNPKTIGSLLQPTTYNPQPTQGFTLIETLVAISILMIAVASPLTIAQKGLTSAIYAKDQITASYLAQDAIEYLRNISDKNVNASPSLNWLDGIINSNQCTVLCTVDTTISLGAEICTDDGRGVCDDKPLYYENGIYKQSGSNSKISSFTRSVKVEEIVTGIEALITVKVSWKDKGKDRDLTVSARIFNWR